MPATVVARRMQRNVCVQYKLLFKDEDSIEVFSFLELKASH